MPDDLLHGVADAQVRFDVDAVGPTQLGRQLLQALARIGLDNTAGLIVVGQPTAQILKRRAADGVRQRQRPAARLGQQSSPLCRVPRRRRKVGRCDDGT